MSSNDTVSPLDTASDATIWLTDGVPERMYWRGQRWRVTDEPTEPEGFYWPTHSDGAAWRFQATADDGASLVFDVIASGNRWRVAHIYE